MRDLAAHEKHQHQRVLKEMEDKLSELNDLKKAKQSLSAQVGEQRAMVTELQEQVDAALGAEEMVEQLTDRNLALEEKIGELQDAVADLEQLHDMNEELQETARETELELREELDTSRTKIQEMIKERDAIHEMVADRNGTIDKFREVVQQMQQSNLQLREALQRETNKPVGAPPEVIDYQKMFTETKTFTKTIDLELRKLDVQQALQHVSYLCTYMPDSFMARGGNHFIDITFQYRTFEWTYRGLPQRPATALDVEAALQMRHAVRSSKRKVPRLCWGLVQRCQIRRG